MSLETVQFIEMVRKEFTLMQISELERHEILLNLAQSVLDGVTTTETAAELREQYRKED